MAALADDGFVVAWVSTEGADDGGPGVFAQRYDAAGAPRGGELRMGGSPVRIARSVSVAGETGGGFAVAWAGGPLELVLRRYDAASAPLGGPLSSRDARGNFLQAAPALLAGAVPRGAAATCTDFICFTLGVTVPTARPARHMDATFREALEVKGGDAASRTWTLHVGGSFDDLPRTSPFYRFGETLLHFGVSGGCGTAAFCPDAPTTREQMAAFLLTAKLGQGYLPPRPATGVFTDVPTGDPFAPWVEDLWKREIVEGCGSGLYCPGDPVTRAQMAVMLLRTREGTAYAPPPCTAPAFADVPCSDPFARWINELAARGITAGCGGGNYCPGGSVTRAQMAVFVTRAFGLDLDAPATLAGPADP